MTSDDLAFGLMRIAAELLAADRTDIAAMYRDFNSRYFDGVLPDISVKWGRSKLWAGICKGRWNRIANTGTVQEIQISDYIAAAGEEVIRGVMLHEMVHAYSIVTGKYDGHGMMFMGLLHKMSSKVGFSIPRSEDISHFTVPEEVETKPVIAVVYDEKAVAIYNWRSFMASVRDILYRLETYVDKRSGIDVSVRLVESRELMKYPEKRKFKIEAYMLPRNIIEEIFAKGKELARFVSGREPVVNVAV